MGFDAGDNRHSPIGYPFAAHLAVRLVLEHFGVTSSATGELGHMSVGTLLATLTKTALC